MSYALSAALQAAVYQRLIADPGVATHLGAAVYDAVPAGPVPVLYALIGQEDVRDRSDQSTSGAEHRITVSVVSTDAGFATVKSAASAISDALLLSPLSLSRGRVVGLWFYRASARTASDGTRKVDQVFRARVEDI